MSVTCPGIDIALNQVVISPPLCTRHLVAFCAVCVILLCVMSCQVFEDAVSRFPANHTEGAPSKPLRTFPEYSGYQTKTHLRQANEDSHARRVAAIEAKKQEREGGGTSGPSSLGVFKW